MIIGKGGVDLSKREVSELPDYFLWNKPSIVPEDDPADRYTCTRDAWAPAVDSVVILNHATDLSHRRHCFDYNDLRLR